MSERTPGYRAELPIGCQIAGPATKWRDELQTARPHRIPLARSSLASVGPDTAKQEQSDEGDHAQRRQLLRDKIAQEVQGMADKFRKGRELYFRNIN